ALRRDISREVASYPHSRCVQSSTARSDLALETAEDGARRLPRLRHRSIAQPSNCKGRPRHRWIDARGGSGQPSALTDAATETAGKPNDIDLTTIGQDRDTASARGALDRLGPTLASTGTDGLDHPPDTIRRILAVPPARVELERPEMSVPRSTCSESTDSTANTSASSAAPIFRSRSKCGCIYETVSGMAASSESTMMASATSENLAPLRRM